MADLQPDGDALLDPGPGLLAAAHVPVVDLDADAASRVLDAPQILRQLPAVRHDRLGIIRLEGDGQDHHVNRGQPWWQHQPIVIGMRHDEATDETGRDAPGRRPAMHAFPLIAEVDDVLCPGEVLAQEVGSSGLQCFSVLHHRLDAKRVVGTGESLGLGLAPTEHGHRHPVFAEVGIHIEHPRSMFNRLVGRCVRGMPFLPEKLGGTEKEPGPHLPTNDVRPLVDQQRQIPIRLDPAGECFPDDRLGSRPNHEWFIQFSRRDQSAIGAGLKPVVGDDGAFLGKPLDMLGFLLEETLGYEKGEVGVLVTGRLEHPIEHLLELLPEGATPRA